MMSEPVRRKLGEKEMCKVGGWAKLEGGHVQGKERKFTVAGVYQARWGMLRDNGAVGARL